MSLEFGLFQGEKISEFAHRSVTKEDMWEERQTDDLKMRPTQCMEMRKVFCDRTLSLKLFLGISLLLTHLEAWESFLISKE